MIENEKQFKEKLAFLELTPLNNKRGEKPLFLIRAGSTSWNTKFPINDAFERRLKEENERMEIKVNFQKKYPFLHPGVFQDKRVSSLWVERNGRDAEAMPSPKNRETWEYTEEEFVFLNEEARKANQEGWFFCTGCGVAKPDEEYSYFHFAGRYCLKCKEADLRAYREAINENYN